MLADQTSSSRPQDRRASSQYGNRNWGSSFHHKGQKPYQLPQLEKLPLQPTQVSLWTYTEESISMLKELTVHVTCQGINHTLPFLVVKRGLSKPHWKELINKVSIRLEKSFLQSLENSNWWTVTPMQQCFRKQAWVCERYESTLFAKENSTLKYFLKPILSHLHSVIKFLTSLTTFRQDIVPVKFSSWAVPVVPVIKCDGNVRLQRLQTGYQQRNKEWSILYPLPWI